MVLTFLAQGVAHAQEASRRQLTYGNFSSRSPSWSPDGARLVFESDRSGSWGLYVLELGTGVTAPLTTTAADDRYPAWSPEGERVVFVRTRDGNPDLTLLDLRSGEVSTLTELTGEELFPAWSPDGREVAFTLRTDTTFALMKLRVDEPQRVIPLATPGRDLWPRWSGNGRFVAFFSRRDTGGADDEIHLLDLSTGLIARITHGPGHDFCPSWSPQSERLVFVAVSPNGSRSLRVVDTQGRRLADSARGFHRVTEPAWSPDGLWIAFAGVPHEGGSYQLFVERAPESSPG